MRLFKYTIVLLLMVLFDACTRKVKYKRFLPKDEEKGVVIIDDSVERNNIRRAILEAKLADIPIPFGLCCIERFLSTTQESDEQVVMGYFASDTIAQELKTFYQCEMERFGWKEIAFFQGAELQLIFIRPRKLCTISIRPQQQNACELVLCVGSCKV